MSYFGVQTGRLPLDPPHGLVLWPTPDGWTLTWPAAPLGITAIVVLAGPAQALQEVTRLRPSERRWAVAPGYGPALSIAWVREAEISQSATPVLITSTQERAAETPIVRLCPLCRTPLQADGPFWRCVGRCRSRWLEESPGRLIDPASLPFGMCACCPTPRALIRAASDQPICPQTAQPHLLRVDGTTVLVAALAYGVCSCCTPAMPLIALGAAVVCEARPMQHYTQHGTRWLPLSNPSSAAAVLDAIDTALKTNTAKLNVYGLFDLD